MAKKELKPNTLRYCLWELRMTPQEFAELTGLSRINIYNMLDGVKAIRVETVRKIYEKTKEKFGEEQALTPEKYLSIYQ